MDEPQRDPGRNVLGMPLATCGCNPMTGFYRDGRCETGPDDRGVHTVCCEVTPEFLAFARNTGNDLITRKPEFDFPGLRSGDRWCVCAATWLQAHEAGVACPIVLEATHERTLETISLEVLVGYAIARHA